MEPLLPERSVVLVLHLERVVAGGQVGLDDRVQLEEVVLGGRPVPDQPGLVLVVDYLLGRIAAIFVGSLVVRPGDARLRRGNCSAVRILDHHSVDFGLDLQEGLGPLAAGEGHIAHVKGSAGDAGGDEAATDVLVGGGVAPALAFSLYNKPITVSRPTSFPFIWSVLNSFM